MNSVTTTRNNTAARDGQNKKVNFPKERGTLCTAAKTKHLLARMSAHTPHTSRNPPSLAGLPTAARLQRQRWCRGELRARGRLVRGSARESARLPARWAGSCRATDLSKDSRALYSSAKRRSKSRGKPEEWQDTKRTTLRELVGTRNVNFRITSSGYVQNKSRYHGALLSQMTELFVGKRGGNAFPLLLLLYSSCHQTGGGLRGW